MEATILAMLISAATVNGLDSKLVVAVAKVESQLDHSAVSPAGAYGVLQIRRIAFPQYTLDEIRQLDMNIAIGVRHLVYMAKHCKFKKNNSWVICFNRGVRGASRDVGNPYVDKYYLKVMKEFKKLNDQKLSKM